MNTSTSIFLRIAVVLLAVGGSFASSARADDNLRSMIVQSLRANYALYAPFQHANPEVADYPGSISARGRDFEGDSIDIPVAHWSNAYNADGILDFRPQRAVVLQGADRIAERKTLEPSLGLKLLAFLNLSASCKHVQQVTIEFGGTQRRYQIDETTFNRLRERATPDFKAAIRFRIAKKQTKGLMVVVRAVSTDALKYTLSTNSTANAELTLKELQEISAKLKDTSVTAKLAAEKGTEVVIELKGEFLIAYQAIRWEDSILSTLTSPPRVLFEPLELTPEEFKNVFGT